MICKNTIEVYTFIKKLHLITLRLKNRLPNSNISTSDFITQPSVLRTSLILSVIYHLIVMNFSFLYSYLLVDVSNAGARPFQHILDHMIWCMQQGFCPLKQVRSQGAPCLIYSVRLIGYFVQRYSFPCLLQFCFLPLKSLKLAISLLETRNEGL